MSLKLISRVTLVAVVIQFFLSFAFQFEILNIRDEFYRQLLFWLYRISDLPLILFFFLFQKRLK